MEETLQLPQTPTYVESEENKLFREDYFGKPPPVIARFYMGAVKDDAASQEAGAPVYRDTPMVLVNVSGERDCMTSRVDEERKRQFPKEWAYFSKAASQPAPIPLQALPKMTPSIQAAFQELGIKSVQMLAVAEIPGYLAQWRPWAIRLLQFHEFADKPKPKVKLIDGQVVPA